jgi:hypothetical protein
MNFSSLGISTLPTNHAWKDPLAILGAKTETSVGMKLTCYFVLVGVSIVSNRNAPQPKTLRPRRKAKPWSAPVLCRAIDEEIQGFNILFQNQAAGYSSTIQDRIERASLFLSKVLLQGVLSMETLFEHTWSLHALSQLYGV